MKTLMHSFDTGTAPIESGSIFLIVAVVAIIGFCILMACINEPKKVKR